MFAIYPRVDAKSVRKHAVVFTDDPKLAELLCIYFETLLNTKHEAYLVLESWPDPHLINNLNGCGESVHFSIRTPTAAHDASIALRPKLQGWGVA